MPDRLLRAAWAALVLWCVAVGAQAQPGQVVVGSYVTKVQDVSFKDNKYALDFYLWFRWKAEGALADYKPLDSFELVNGKIENKSSVVEKKIGDTSYASVRVSATISETWDLRQFPFDSHRLRVHLEDSAHGTDDETTKALAATAKSAPTPRPKRGSRSLGLTMKATKATAVAASTVDSSFQAVPKVVRSMSIDRL